MGYPEELLPKSCYIRIDTDRLDTDAVFLRRIDVACNAIPYDDFGELPASVFIGNESIRKINGLSLSLCGIFLPKHFVYKVLPSEKCPDPNAYWEPGTDCCRKEDIAFDFIDEYCTAYLPAENWHRKRFPLRNEFEMRDSYSFSGTILIEHRPTKSNFWHFELTFYEDVESFRIMKKNKSEWQKKAYMFVFNDLVSSGGILFDSVPCRVPDTALYFKE